MCPQSPFHVVLENTIKSGIKSENHFFLCEKGQSVTLAGEKTIAAGCDQNVRTIFGKLLEFYSKNISFDLVPISGVICWKQREPPPGRGQHWMDDYKSAFVRIPEIFPQNNSIFYAAENGSQRNGVIVLFFLL